MPSAAAPSGPASHLPCGERGATAARVLQPWGGVGSVLPSNFCAGSNCFGGPSMAHSALQDQYPRLSSHAWASATSSGGANAANYGWLQASN